MKIKWLGHSCFLLTSAAGIRVLMDPFDSRVGYALPEVEADIVTTSHNHFDHNYIAAVKGDFTHLGKPGRYDVAGIMITGTAAFHDDAGGIKRGGNVIYKFDIDGVRICHCGDLGHMPTPEQVEDIGGVDVLLVPVGGTFTITAADAVKVVELLNPSIAIPMHFKTEALSFQLDGVDKFLATSGVQAGGTAMAGKQEIEITSDNLAALPKVIVLDYKT